MQHIKYNYIFILLISVYIKYQVFANLSLEDSRLDYKPLIDDEDIDYNEIEKKQMPPVEQNDQPIDNNLMQDNNPILENESDNSVGNSGNIGSGSPLNLPSMRPNCNKRKSK
jgi:hypothetical protein